MRERYNQALQRLQQELVHMAAHVSEELELARSALQAHDSETAQQIIRLDEQVNQERFQLERDSFELIATQQPTAGDLRTILSVMSMIVDLERMGDQAKGIAKAILSTTQRVDLDELSELDEMSKLALEMLQQAITAYTEHDVSLALAVAQRDDEMDELHEQVLGKLMRELTKVTSSHQAQHTYATLRVARELERFGDLVTNMAERVVFNVTGQMVEINRELIEFA